MKKAITLLFIAAIIAVALVIKTMIPKVDASTSTKITPESEFAKKIDLEKSKNLIIVAHPDDETIWGGDHLLEEDYLVVCVTCGTNKNRDKEIRNVLDVSDDELIKLGYPDNPGGVVSDWEEYKEDIIKDLTSIITMKEYDKIVTHNPQGEYGHIHHVMINHMVTEIVKDKYLANHLYYFAKYYTKDEIDLSNAAKFPIKNYNKKINEMVKLYKSQSFIQTSFAHVMGSEQWQKYTDLVNLNTSKTIKA